MTRLRVWYMSCWGSLPPKIRLALMLMAVAALAHHVSVWGLR